MTHYMWCIGLKDCRYSTLDLFQQAPITVQEQPTVQSTSMPDLMSQHVHVLYMVFMVITSMPDNTAASTLDVHGRVIRSVRRFSACEPLISCVIRLCVTGKTIYWQASALVCLRTTDVRFCFR